MGYGSKGLNDLRDEAYACSKSHGFYDDGPPDFGMRMALIHSEISEALEDFRSGKGVGETWYEISGQKTASASHQDIESGLNIPHKPCGIPSEIADVIIRCLDFCGANGIDIEAVVRDKMAFNESRPHKHGRKC